MAKSLIKGESSQVSTRFPSGARLPTAPVWSLLDWNGNLLLDGIASPDSTGAWVASFTVPQALIIPGGEQDLTIQFSGVDSRGVQNIRSKVISVIDAIDQWRDYGLLFTSGSPFLTDTAFFNAQPNTLTAVVQEGFGNTPTILASSGAFTPTYTSVTSLGLAYSIKVPIPAGALANHSGGTYPYQLVVTADFGGGQETDTVIKPVYIRTPQITTYLSAMRRYLDKARMDEIDKSLQWNDEELVHFLLEGMNYINGFGEPTYWTVHMLPPNMVTYLHMAGCWVALNARYLAEGMNSFEFSGANTQFSYQNRSTFIQTKMDELQNQLTSNLQIAKGGAIRIFGKGVPPPNAMPADIGNLGRINIALGPLTNRARFLYNNPANSSGWRY